MVAAADAVVAAVCLLGAALTLFGASRVRAGETGLISGYNPGDLPPERERVLARRVSVLGVVAAAYTALGAPLALLGLPDAVWLWWTAGYLLVLPAAYATHPDRWPPGE